MLPLQLSANLLKHGYQRIERDDRLLDILPGATREKGVELWEKEEPDRLLLIHLRLPYHPEKTIAYSIPRSIFHLSLLHNTPLSLISWQLPSVPSFLNQSAAKKNTAS